MDAFYILGPQEGSVVPELVRLMCDPRRNKSSGRAQNALASIGQPAVPQLLVLLRNPRDPNREGIVHCIAMMRGLDESARPVVPFLVECLHEKPVIAHSAAYALGKCSVEAQVAVPALAESLKSTDN